MFGLLLINCFLAQSNLLTKIAYLLKNFKYYIFCTAPAVILCKSDMADPNERKGYGACEDLMCLLVYLAILLTIPVLMLVFGIKNDELVCQSTTCIDLECKSESNTPLHLGAPSIGITVSQALIVGGCFGLLISICIFAATAYSRIKSFIKSCLKSSKPVENQQQSAQQPKMKITRQKTKLHTYISICVGGFSVLMCLACVCWMCVSFGVYSQYTQMCSDYNKKFSIVPSISMNILIASNILGIIFAVGNLCYLLAGICHCEDEFCRGCCRDCCETTP